MFCRMDAFSDKAVSAFSNLIDRLKNSTLMDLQEAFDGIFDLKVSMDHGNMFKAQDSSLLLLKWKNGDDECELHINTTEIELVINDEFAEEVCSLGHVGCQHEHVTVYDIRMYVEGEDLVISYYQEQSCRNESCFKVDFCNRIYVVYDSFDRNLKHVETRARQVTDNLI